jgi:hypothetical protein
VGALAIFVGAAAGDDDVTASVSLTAGSMSMVSPSTITFSDALGTNILSTSGATYLFDGTDTPEVKNPGALGGWNITATSSGLACEDSAKCGTTKLTDLAVNGATSTAPGDNSLTEAWTCTGSCVAPTPTSAASYPASITSSAVGIFNADVNSGIGDITTSFKWWLTVPYGTPATDYQGTITLALNTGPTPS